jgi:hypothetical protein
MVHRRIIHLHALVNAASGALLHRVPYLGWPVERNENRMFAAARAERRRLLRAPAVTGPAAPRSSPKHPIGGATDRRRAAVQDVRVDHGGAQVTVSEQFLDRANVVTVLEEMRREGVPEGVTRGSLGQARLEDGFLDRPLEHGFMEVMTALW